MAQRKKNEDALLLALAWGATVENAAKQCGLCDRTVYRRLEDPAFRTRLRETRTDMVRRASGMLTAAAGEAARAVLEIGIKVRELAEFEADGRQLEEQVKALSGAGNRGWEGGR
ncbi:MAG: hypothetical protein JWO38_4766 [Gemmataceae bacterium]|nr:hypothetical protein [Gemmataceae bacterium]